MKNVIVGLIIIVLIGGGIYYFVNSSKENTDTSSPSSLSQQSLVSPDRQAEINGYIINIEGNELTVANEIGAKEISDEERARRQSMSPEERQALKAQESANVTKENVTLSIPVGVPIVKGSGTGNGVNVKAEMTELVKGIYISIWKTGDSVEFVKLKGVSQE